MRLEVHRVLEVTRGQGFSDTLACTTGGFVTSGSVSASLGFDVGLKGKDDVIWNDEWKPVLTRRPE